MAVTRLTTNGLSGTKYDIASADNYYMEPIATTLLSSAASSITFSNIPNTYKHLQIRGISRITSGTYAQVFFRVNGISSTSYSGHYLIGTGSAVSATANLSTTAMIGGVMSGSTQTSGIFGATVTDILDYANANKNTTIRTLSGVDGNGSGYAWFSSGIYLATDPINSVTLVPETSTFDTNTRFSLYGIKG